MTASPVLNGITPLDHLGVIRVAGADAVSFLQGQLTNDFALLPADEARLAAFLSAKGRMQASFVGWLRAPGEVVLVCHRSLLEAVRKRLSMFVLRAKAQLSDATPDFGLYGVAGPALATLAGGAYPAWKKLDIETAQLVVLPVAAGQPRALWLAPAVVPPPQGPALAADTWRWAEVASGVATLESAVVDAFVPQMLNFESVGGVNFKKGCYPGQEIVARSQFRGTLKRRAYVVHADVALAVGQEVFHSSDAGQPCGTVAQASPAPGGGCDAIVSMQTSAASGGALHAGAPDGPLLELQPLPYPLLEDL